MPEAKPPRAPDAPALYPDAAGRVSQAIALADEAFDGTAQEPAA